MRSLSQLVWRRGPVPRTIRGVSPTTARTALAASLLSLGPVTGCGSELPIQYETEHLRIATDFDHPLCKGDLVALERIISTVEDELSVKMKRVTTVYVWDDDHWHFGPNENCSATALGCINYSTSTIWTSREMLEHELVHAVVATPSLAPFFDEAIADVYAGRQARFGDTAPTANAGTSWLTADRQVGRHFIRWLREQWGAEALGELTRAGGDSFKAFRSVYGVSIEAAEALYFEEAPYGYPSMYGCDGPRLTEQSAGVAWADVLDLDCGAGEDTRVGGIGMSVHRTFVVTEPGFYTFNLDADWFDIFRCSGPRVDQAPLPGEAWEDAPLHHSAFPSGGYQHYYGRTVRDLYLEAGTHDINIGLLGHDQGTARIAIWPSSGAQPATPG